MPPIKSAEQLAHEYRVIRDGRKAATSAYKKQDARYTKALENIGGAMLQFLSDTGQHGSQTTEGTFWKEEDILPSAADWDVYYAFLIENDLVAEGLEKRIKKTFVKTYMKPDLNKKVNIPPGLNVLRKDIVKVRKPGTTIGAEGDDD